MNIIRQREQLKLLLSTKLINQRQSIEFATSPVFKFGKHQPLTEDELEWCHGNLCEGESHVPIKFPFECFTILYDDPDSSVEPCVLRVISRNHTTSCPETGKPLEMKLAVYVSVKVDKDDCIFYLDLTGYRSRGALIALWRAGRWINVNNPLKRAAAQTALEIPKQILMDFAFATMNPGSVVVRVDPPKKTCKSVEWHLARRHYVILTQDHAQRCVKHRRGPTDAEIKRSAHWRRAHMRRLSAERYKQKKGQLVFVKKAWVGPLEWIGTDGKEYKVIPTGGLVAKSGNIAQTEEKNPT